MWAKSHYQNAEHLVRVDYKQTLTSLHTPAPSTLGNLNPSNGDIQTASVEV